MSNKNVVLKKASVKTLEANMLISQSCNAKQYSCNNAVSSSVSILETDFPGDEEKIYELFPQDIISEIHMCTNIEVLDGSYMYAEKTKFIPEKHELTFLVKNGSTVYFDRCEFPRNVKFFVSESSKANFLKCKFGGSVKFHADDFSQIRQTNCECAPAKYCVVSCFYHSKVEIQSTMEVQVCSRENSDVVVRKCDKIRFYVVFNSALSIPESAIIVDGSEIGRDGSRLMLLEEE